MKDGDSKSDSGQHTTTIWQPSPDLISDILEFCWTIARSKKFRDWQFDGSLAGFPATRTRYVPTAMPGNVGRLIFSSGGDSGETFSRLRKGVERGQKGRPAGSALTLLKAFLEKRFTPGPWITDEVFKGNEAQRDDIYAHCREMIDEHSDAVANILRGIASASEEIELAYQQRDELDNPPRNEPWATMIGVNDFKSDEAACRAFLRGGTVQYSCVTEATIERDELGLIIRGDFAAKKLLIVTGPIACGRTTFLMQLAKHYVSEGQTVWMVRGHQQWQHVIERAMQMPEPAKTVVICDDLYFASSAFETVPTLPFIENWVKKSSEKQPCMVFATQSRFLSSAHAMLHWNSRRIDQVKYETLRATIKLKSVVSADQMLPVHEKYSSLDHGVSIEDARRNFEAFYKNGIWAANFAATHAGGLKRHFISLVEEARKNGWLYSLAAITIVNQNAHINSAGARNRWLTRAWREAVEWYFDPAQLPIRDSLGDYNSQNETKDSFRGVLHSFLCGEIQGLAAGGPEIHSINFRIPLIGDIVEEEIFGWIAKNGHYNAQFKARKLDWIIALNDYFVSEKIKVENESFIEKDVLSTWMQYKQDMGVVWRNDDISAGHSDTEYPEARDLFIKFADKLKVSAAGRFATLVAKIEEKAIHEKVTTPQ